MLDLLFTVSLNSLEKRLKTLLVLLSELLHLPDQSHLQILVHNFGFILLLLFDHVSHSVRFIVVLDREENFLLLAHLDQILAVALLEQESLSNLLFMEHKLLLLLDLELLDQFESRRLVVAHVLVPRVRELLKLQFLGALNVHELLFLRQSHVLFLALLFSPGKLFKPHFHHFSACVVTRGLGIDTKLVHDPDIERCTGRGLEKELDEIIAYGGIAN